ncbi:MAG: serine/threonine-protein kinase [Pseudomonadota bacterium]
MKRGAFWKSEWLIGLGLALLMLLVAGGDLMQSLERKAYDLGVLASSRTPSDRVAVIAIDDQSISNIGRWPWSREVHAKMIDLLAGAQAKVVGNTVFFSEPQSDAGLAYINKLNKFFSASRFRNAIDPALQQEAVQLAGMLQEAEQDLNADRKLAQSIAQAGNVVLAMAFQLGEPRGNPDHPLPDYLTKNALPNVVDAGGAAEMGLLPLSTLSAVVPIAELGMQAAAIGYLNLTPDHDGGVRSEPLVLRHYDHYYPSLPLLLAAKSLNLQAADVQVVLGEGVSLGKLHIATDPELRMNTFFYRDAERPAFQVDSFYDVYSGKIPVSKYAGKIVLIGATAQGVGAPQVTPVSPAMAPVLVLAHSVSSILQEDFFVVPGWGVWAEKGVFLLVALYLMLALPRLKAGLAALFTALLFVALLIAHFALMVGQSMWLQLMTPAALLLIGHLLLTTKRFLVTERGKEKSEAESAESNRMLGLAFQGQGQLDMAFDKFRKLPMDDGVMDLLYNLALDFERKRQFNKAEAVYQHMAAYNAKFRDLEQKLSRAKAMSETVILGGGSASAAISGTVLMAGGGVEKPMLGRYQVEKELGKGAMGVVYMGRDPKIGRVVAIKTMALSQEFEEDELQEVKERFFREAETAGRLSHPNIVTIYDAGEEHDLAYIAMELLKGKDLVPYTKPDNLLPLPKVLSVIARVADALGYAHAQHVVHRDIKPANIMYEPEDDMVKVTDFGIARITDSSKTKTGMVLGTPSYMSPEQLAGKKIDGHSDLFSLGVTLYQLCCGQLPFQGDSMAQLMYKIANDPPLDIRTLRPDLPVGVVLVIARAIAKQPEARYQTGEEMAQAIRQCAAAISNEGA